MTVPITLLLPSDLLLRGPISQTLTIGLLAPVSGLMGVAGPSIINCAILAAEEASAGSDTALELVLVDAGSDPNDVASEVDLLVGTGLVDALVGTHTSNVRRAVEARVADRVPYVFTPPHEVGSVAPGSIFIGSNPEDHLRAPIAWLARHRQVRRWALIGNDYVWPRQMHEAAGDVLSDLGQSVVLNRLVPIGQVDAAQLIDEVRQAGADAILLSLVGRDGIEFHRGVTQLGAGEAFVRLCTALDENCLVAAGGDNSGELYSAMPSFILQDDERHQQLISAYVARFGLVAPLPASYAEGCYDGVRLLAALFDSGLLQSHAAGSAAARLIAGQRSGAHGPRSGWHRGERLPMALARAVGTDLDDVGALAVL